MKLRKGFSRLGTVEHVLYVPGLLDERGNLTTPIGGKKKPFTLILRSRESDEFKASADAFQDAIAKWFEEHSPETHEKQRSETRLMQIDFKAYCALVEDFVIPCIQDWKNAIAEDDKGNLLDIVPYDENALRDLFREEPAIMLQVLTAYAVKNTGKFIAVETAGA
jgi:hypothetical protein